MNVVSDNCVEQQKVNVDEIDNMEYEESFNMKKMMMI